MEWKACEACSEYHWIDANRLTCSEECRWERQGDKLEMVRRLRMQRVEQQIPDILSDLKQTFAEVKKQKVVYYDFNAPRKDAR